MKELIGAIVESVAINGDHSILWFETDRGPVAFETEADCCSETWFADILGADWLIGNRVERVEVVEQVEQAGGIWGLPDYNIEDGRTRQEVDEAYGYKLFTAQNIVDIVFRNSSHGYYGGSIELYRGERPADLTPITEHDWRAGAPTTGEED